MGGSSHARRIGRSAPARVVWLGLGLGLVLQGLGCSGGGDHPPSTHDAAVDAAVEAGDDAAIAEPAVEQPALPAEPMPPAPPVLTPCPAGWREATDPERGTTCEPWPARGPEGCAGDEAHFPGEPGCVRIGSACPAGEWADELPAGATVLYVRAGAPDGGDGSRGAPFGTIAAAMAGARDGTIVALGKGTFDEPVALRAGVTLWGACVAETTITTTSFSSTRPAAILPSGAGSAVRNLRVTGERVCVFARSGASIELEDVVLSGCTVHGLLAGDAASIEGRALVVRDTRLLDGSYGQGVFASEGATVTLERAVIDGALGVGVDVREAGTIVTLQSVAVLHTGRSPALSSVYGVWVSEGARLEAHATFVDSQDDVGIRVEDRRSSIDLTDLVVRAASGPAPAGSLRAGVVADGATASITRTRVDGDLHLGVSVRGGGSATLADVVLAGSGSCPESEQDLLRVDEGASLTGERVVIADACDFAFVSHPGDVSTPAAATLEDLVVWRGRLGGTGASLRLSRVEVRGAPVSADPSSALVTAGGALEVEDLRLLGPPLEYGIICGEGGSLTLRRALLEDVRMAALAAIGAGTEVLVEDLTVRGAPDGDGPFGAGLAIFGEASAEARRLLLERTGRTSVWVHFGARLSLEDATIRDTQLHPDGVGGTAITVEGGSRANVARARVEASRDYGVGARGPGSTLVLRDLQVTASEARSDACSADLCGGVGVVSLDGASVQIERFLVRDNDVAGVQLATEGTMDLHEGLVAGQPIGASVGYDGFDLARLTDRVVFRDNQRSFDATALPVPEPVPPPPALVPP